MSEYEPCTNCHEEITDPTNPNEGTRYVHLHTFEVQCRVEDLRTAGYPEADLDLQREGIANYSACPVPPNEEETKCSCFGELNYDDPHECPLRDDHPAPPTNDEWWEAPEGKIYGPVHTIPIQPDLVLGVLAEEASDLMWIMLPNGDRMVGFYPRADGAEYLHSQKDLDTGNEVVNTVEVGGCDACDKVVPLDELHFSRGVDNGIGDTTQCHECRSQPYGG